MTVDQTHHCRLCGSVMHVVSAINGVPHFECFYPDCPKNLKGKPDNSGVGCGVWPVLLKNTRFYPACEWHDVATMDNSPQSKMFKRWKIDRTFLSHMLDIAGDSKWHRARARLFYAIARSLSWAF